MLRGIFRRLPLARSVVPIVRHNLFITRKLSGESSPQTFENIEKASGPSKVHEFQTETRRLLDIVARSLYTDTEVFVRELISNASDALEKARYIKSSEGGDSVQDLRIKLFTDKENGVLTIQDNGIGMSAEEMVKNLGTIAHSGSKAFVQSLADAGKDGADNVIGQFGVGFYSSFMVADNVAVYSSPMTSDEDGIGFKWQSTGDGHFEISEAQGVSNGTKIILSLKDGFKHFADPDKLKSIVSTYSNFVAFPIELNGQTLNTVQALWTKQPSSVESSERIEFYKYISGAYDEPRMHLHFVTDAPLAIKALFFVPSLNTEQFSFGTKQETQISLYCKRVLIKSKTDTLLPSWLRFLKGVVDSEDIPLNISREHMQDSALIRKLKDVLTKRVIKWLGDEASKDVAKYDAFYKEFKSFIMEGACNTQYGSDVSKLLRITSTAAASDADLFFLSDYVSRMKEGQQKILYIPAQSREVAMQSPYLEGFLKHGLEVLIVDSSLEIVFSNIHSFGGKQFASVEQELPPAASESDKQNEERLSDSEFEELRVWLKETALVNKVADIQATDRLHNYPAVIHGHPSELQRNIMKFRGIDMPDLPHNLHLNPSHPIIRDLYLAKSARPDLALVVADQLLLNALLAAGLVTDTHSLVSKLNNILSIVLKDK